MKLALGSPLQAEAVPVDADFQRICLKQQPRQAKSQRPAGKRGWSLLAALLLPPVGVLVRQDGVVTRWFWIALVLTLLGFFPGLLYALYVISL